PPSSERVSIRTPATCTANTALTSPPARSSPENAGTRGEKASPLRRSRAKPTTERREAVVRLASHSEPVGNVLVRWDCTRGSGVDDSGRRQAVRGAGQNCTGVWPPLRQVEEAHLADG